jgi:hypothetical protein
MAARRARHGIAVLRTAALDAAYDLHALVELAQGPAFLTGS